MSEKNIHNMTDAELFSFIDRDAIASEKITAPRYSYWKSVFRVFFRKKTNIIMLILLVLVFFCSFVLPIFWPYDPMENVLDAATYNLSPAKALAYFNNNPNYQPNFIKWCLGTGNLGNSIMYGIMSSARTSLLLAIICAAINMTIGILLGAVWGFIYNIIANVPYILLISVLVYIIGSGFWPFVFALTVTGWLGIAYFFRTQVMIIRDREYSLASRCLGTPVRRVITKNILPFLTSVIVTILATELPSYISYEVFLSFIGIGLSASVPSLGRMIQQAQSAFLTYPWAFWPPVAIASIITILLYLLGQNLADASDPRTHM